jgi:secreted trypsin-like serine protease
MRRAAFVIATAIATLLFTAAAARAIVYGEPDGTRHPNVGAIVADWREPGVLETFCSGALISETVFLTASHCTDALADLGIEDDEVFVTFDPVFDADTSTLYPGTYFTNPAYGEDFGPMSDPHDVAVIVVDEPIAHIMPAQLPTAGLLDEMKSGHELKDAEFTAVGYGAIRESRRKGFDGILDNNERRMATQGYLSLTDAWLTLAMNQANGNGGTCYGDSGGPHFLGADEDETDVIVSITVTGDAVCKATDKTYRMDTDSARDFLDDFVDLP